MFIPFRYDTVIAFFLENGLKVNQKPLDNSGFVLTKIAKYTFSDPPVEILTLLLKYGLDPNYTDDKNYR
jgi:hypothetical protein